MENVEPVVVKLDVLVAEGVCGAPGSAGRGHAKFRVTRVRPDRVEKNMLFSCDHLYVEIRC